MNTTAYTELLLKWFSDNKRELPWRKTIDPYQIWLSEVILQQTRISQGLPYFEKFTEEFPTVFDLAGASGDEVMLQWQGLGYYSRARNLHKCAKVIVEDYGGKFPESSRELQKLPGIGPYTAAAIASICYNEPAPVLDGNVFRVLSRLFDLNDNIDSPAGKKRFESLANELISSRAPGDFNQAIMEFGALHCSPSNPECASCIFRSCCVSNSRQNQHERPVRKKKVKKKVRYFNYLVLESKLGIFLKKRDDNDIWKGLYDFFLVETVDRNVPARDLIRQIRELRDLDLMEDKVRKYKHLLTHQVIYISFSRIRIHGKHSISNENILFKGNFYLTHEIEKLPKPVMVDKYLKEEIF